MPELWKPGLHQVLQEKVHCEISFEVTAPD